MNRWFKMQTGSAQNPVLALIAKRLNVKRSVVISAFLAASEIASEPHHTLEEADKVEMIAAMLEEDDATIRDIIAQLDARGMLDVEAVNQVSSNAERQKRFRDKKRNVTSNADSNVTSNALEREKEREKERPPISPPQAGEAVEEGIEKSFSEFWSARAGRGNAADSETEARREFLRAVEQGVEPETLVKAMRAYAAVQRDNGKAGTQMSKAASGFLRDGLWRQYAGEQAEPDAPKAQTFDELAAARGVAVEPWLRKLAERIGGIEAINWFGKVVVDTANEVIVFPSKMVKDFVINRYEREMRDNIGDFEWRVA